ncbi:hypothetical protein SAMN05444340_11454 [Citreimonas salinaria]|uniref:Uncharacterized protein n=2 Tax=Citreimonas salinaria TaxID=321339 RepID=A0A1H3LTF7_9RHOB|nr:hypothetical protein SAMN05444340_11454 [Citreimonas salinaria]
MMAEGPWQFQAGSVARFAGDGTFTFRHDNGGEAGSFRVFSDDTVELRDRQTGRNSRFYVDRTPGRPDTVVCLSGPYKGQSFALK